MDVKEGAEYQEETETLTYGWIAFFFMDQNKLCADDLFSIRKWRAFKKIGKAFNT